MKYANRVVTLGAVILLAPHTLLCFFGFLLSLGYGRVLTPGTGTILLQPISMLVWFYSLLCIWWLVFRFRDINLHTIPILIWLGLALGLLGTTLFAVALHYRTMPAMEAAAYFYLFGGGPMLIASMMMLLMVCQNRRM